jgi:predicted P-loop ATPase
MSPPAPTLVHSVEELPPVDLSPAIERPQAQLVIVTSASDRDRLRLVLPDLCAIVWDTTRIDVDLAELQAREGRRAFIWLAREKTTDWLGFQLTEMGYAVNVIKKLAGNKHDQVMAQSGSEIQSWVKAHMNAWVAPAIDEPVDVIPDPVVEQPPAPEPAAVMAHEEAADALAALARQQGIPAIGKRMRIDDWTGMGLHISQGKPTPNVSNVSMLFDHIKPGEIWYDTFRQSIMTVDGPGRAARRWTDADDIRLTIEVQRNCGMVKVAKGTVTDAVVEFAMRNLRNELREYVMDLQWDGISRIDKAFEDLFGVQRSDYNRDVSRNFFRSAVARALWPGCKVDTMIVLEGEQGIGKSTVLEKLGGPWYSIMRDSPDSKDFAIVLAGKWIVEIAELDVFLRSSSSSSKRALSTAVDTYRPPYGKHSLDHPRSSIFAGSVNRKDWNRDATGARRYWPVDCKWAKPEIAARWRDQYFAEAFHLMIHETPPGQNPDWWKFTQPDQVLAEQEARYMVDDWEATISFYLKGKSKVAPNQIYDEVLMIDIKDRNHRTHGVRVADIMRRLGWESKSLYTKATGQKRFWINKDTWTGG